MTNRSISHKRNGLKSHQRRASLEELLWLETETAAAKGRCQAQLTPKAYAHVETQEQAEYLAPAERLDFWRGIEIRIVNGEADAIHQEAEPPQRKRTLEGFDWPPVCPDCGLAMEVKHQRGNGSNAPFWSCVNFPHCRGRADFQPHPDDLAQANGDGREALFLTFQRAQTQGLVGVSAGARHRRRRRPDRCPGRDIIQLERNKDDESEKERTSPSMAIRGPAPLCRGGPSCQRASSRTPPADPTNDLGHLPRLPRYWPGGRPALLVQGGPKGARIMTQLSLFPTPATKPVNLKNCTHIYTPKGRAREYAALACNVYRGCDHGCTYCYAPSATQRTREDFNAVTTRPDFLRKVKRDAAKYAAAGVTGQVLLSFTGDPYCNLDVSEQVTRRVIKILHAYGLNFQILTKGGSRALRDLDLYRPGDAFATTLTFTAGDDRSREFEPGAASPADRIATIHKFHRAGVPTWVSLEPVLDPAEALALIETTHSVVDLFKVGTLNYHPLAKTVDWRRFGQDAIALLKSLGYTRIEADQANECNRTNKGYYIKRALRAHLVERDGAGAAAGGAGRPRQTRRQYAEQVGPGRRRRPRRGAGLGADLPPATGWWRRRCHGSGQDQREGSSRGMPVLARMDDARPRGRASSPSIQEKGP